MCLQKYKYACGHKADTETAKRCEKSKTLMGSLSRAFNANHKCKHVRSGYHKHRTDCHDCSLITDSSPYRYSEPVIQQDYYAAHPVAREHRESKHRVSKHRESKRHSTAVPYESRKGSSSRRHTTMEYPFVQPFVHEYTDADRPWRNNMHHDGRDLPEPEGSMFEAPREAPKAPVPRPHSRIFVQSEGSAFEPPRCAPRVPQQAPYSEKPTLANVPEYYQVNPELLKHSRIKSSRKRTKESSKSNSRRKTDESPFQKGLTNMGEAFGMHLRPEESEASFGCITAEQQTRQGHREMTSAPHKTARRVKSSHAQRQRIWR